MAHNLSKTSDNMSTEPTNAQLRSNLFNCPPEVLLAVLDRVVGERGSLNVRLSLPPNRTTWIAPPHESKNNASDLSLIRPFVHLSEEPFWKRFCFEKHDGFSHLLSFMQTCQQGYEVGVKILYDHPVFTFDRLETAVFFFDKVPVAHRNTVQALKLALPYSDKVPCICPLVDEFTVEMGLSEDPWHRRVEIGSTRQGCETELESTDRQSEPGDADLHYSGDGDSTSTTSSSLERLAQASDLWVHGKNPEKLDTLLLSLPGLKTLVLEENPSILAPVLLGDASDESWLEKIKDEKEALRKTQKHVEDSFGSRLEVIVREHRGEDAVGKWASTGFAAENVERYLGGLPVVNDGMWVFW